MIQQRKKLFHMLVLLTALSFLVASCSLFGKMKETKSDNSAAGKTVRIDDLESVKGVNPPNPASPPPPKKPSASPPPSSPQPAPPRPPQTASLPPRLPYSPSLPFLEVGFKKKVVILDFENKTTYQDEKIGDAVTKKLSDRLEATQRLVIMDRTVVEDRLKKQGIQTEKLTSPVVMKTAYHSLWG